MTAIAQLRQHHEIRVVRNAENSGSVFRQWLKGVEMARGDYVWIAEADDLCAPGFLETAVQAFVDRGVVLSYTESRQVGEHDEILAENYRNYWSDIDPHRWEHAYVRAGVDEIVVVLAVKNSIPNVSAFVFRREPLLVALRQGIDAIANYRVAGDWAVYARVLERGKIAFDPQPLNFSSPTCPRRYLGRRQPASFQRGRWNAKMDCRAKRAASACGRRQGVRLCADPATALRYSIQITILRLLSMPFREARSPSFQANVPLLNRMPRDWGRASCRNNHEYSDLRGVRAISARTWFWRVRKAGHGFRADRAGQPRTGHRQALDGCELVVGDLMDHGAAAAVIRTPPVRCRHALLREVAGRRISQRALRLLSEQCRPGTLNLLAAMRAHDVQAG